MKHEITLKGYTVDPTGSIQVDYQWNDYQTSRLYPDEGQMISINADILQDPEDVIRWLMFYLFSLGFTPQTMASAIGKKLVVDIGPAVQQTIAMV
jgi:hypothetical protein